MRAAKKITDMLVDRQVQLSGHGYVSLSLCDGTRVLVTCAIKSTRREVNCKVKYLWQCGSLQMIVP